MGIFDFNISIINKFLGNFKELFSKKQFKVFSLSVYSLFKEYSRSCLQAMADKANCDYQAFQYFYADAKWSLDKVNTKRLDIIQNQRPTASTPKGALVVDDTGSAKPYAKATEGAKYQHCPSLNREEVCNVAVASCFSSGSKYFPINLKFYKPESEFKYGKYDKGFKSKIDLALELVQDATAKKIRFKAVVMDSWYTSNDFLKFISSHDLTFVSEVKPNRLLLFYHPVKRRHCWIQQDELVKLIRSHYSHKLKPVKVRHANGYKRDFFSYSFKSKLKDCPFNIRVVVLFGNFCDEDSKSIHVLITNDLLAYTPTVVSQYSLRWGIERIFKELKDTFSFDQYQVRHKKQIKRYWMLCFIVWSLVYWIKQNGYLTKIIDRELNSFNDYKKAIDSLLVLSSSAVISKNSDAVCNLYGLKSNRMKKALGVAA